MSDLITQLRDAPQSFNLFQAISLLERGEPARTAVGRGLGMDEALRLASQVEQAFAPSDIAGVADSGRPGPPLTLRTAALTLAGAQGPVAAPFTELLLERRRQRDNAGLDFLDIFNQRLLGFWYRARSKHHLALQPALAGSARNPVPLERSVDALSGLGRTEGAHGPAGETAWLRHAGLQGAEPRSMVTLLAVLRERVGIAFEGQQFVGSWETLEEGDRARLRGTMAGALHATHGLGLGQGAALGARAWDQSAGIGLRAPPLSPEQFAAWLPDGAQCRLLAWLVARHVQRDMSITVALHLASAPVCRLAALTGPAPALAPRLGRSAWLCGRSDGIEKVSPPEKYQQVRFMLKIVNGKSS